MANEKRAIRRLTTKMRGKLSIVFLGIFCLFLLLVIRLIYWNVKDGSKFRNIVLGQQNHTSTTIAYERGKIYDRNGNILAGNEKVYTLILEPKNILINSKDPQASLAATTSSLAKYLGLDEEKLTKRIKDNENSYYEIYKEDGKELSFDQVEAFKDFYNKRNLKITNKTPTAEKLEIETAMNISGVMFEESYRRIYPYKSLACRVLGFTSAGNQGNWGIEQQYNEVLNGVNGRSYYYFNEELTQEQTVKEAVNGNSVVSTIDMRIQKIIEKKLKKYDEKIGSKETNILVMDPRDGQVLAMAGSDPYDLNDPMNEENLLTLYSQKEIDTMKAYTEYKEKEAQEKAEAEAAALEEEAKGSLAEEEAEDTDGDAGDKEAEDVDGDAGDKEAGDADGDAEDKEAEDADGDTEDKEAGEEDADAEDKEAEDEDADAKDQEDKDKKDKKKKQKKQKFAKDQKTIYDGFYDLWRNSIISDTKEPGSTYKPFTVAAGFENGTLKGNEEYSCEGSKAVGRRRIGCSHVHGEITLKQAISESCNVAMMNIAYKEGADKFYYYQHLFGFGRKTGIDLPGEADTSTLVYNADNYQNDVTLCTNSFGQNFNCSMIQIAAGFASLINGGNYYKPWVVKQIQSDNGDVVEDMQKTLVRNTVSEETSRTLRDYLQETVVSGTGKIAQMPGYTIGGKTGTAEKIPRNKEDYYISFIGFAPVDNPEIMVYVTIDEPNVENQATAGPAVNLARQCMEEILPLLDIEPTEEVTQSDLDRYKLYTGHEWKPVGESSKKK